MIPIPHREMDPYVPWSMLDMKIFSLVRGDGLRSKSVRSSLFTLLNISSENLLRLGGNLVLTRLLFPEAFGIMALVQLVMTGLKMFSDIGVRLSIIQNEQGEDPQFLDTAWVIQISRGVFLWLATWALAAPVAAFYDAPILAQLLPVAGLLALFEGFNSTKLATASRNLALGRATMINLIARVVGLAALIALAFLWANVWAMVIGGLVAPFLIMVLSHTALPGHRNRFRFKHSAAHALFRFGRYIFLSTLAGFLVMQADRAILGKFVSLSDLALYNIAAMLATLPKMVQQQLFDKVLFALYSHRPPADSPENYRNIARARLIVVGISLLLLAAMALGGNALIVLLYDSRYEAAGPLLVMMAVAALPGLISGGYPTMVATRGHSGRFALIISASAVLRTIILLIAVPYFGVVGAALSPLIATLLFYPAMVWLIQPYKGWIPQQDLGFGLIALAVAALALWINQDAVHEALVIFSPAS